jgi:hypothetical protein
LSRAGRRDMMVFVVRFKDEFSVGHFTNNGYNGMMLRLLTPMIPQIAPYFML